MTPKVTRRGTLLVAAGGLAVGGGLLAPAAISLLLSKLDSPVTDGALKLRSVDLLWGAAGVPVWALLSVGCPHCARWESSELLRFLSGPVSLGLASLILRDSPRDTQGATAAVFLSALPRSNELDLLNLLRLRERMSLMDGFRSVLTEARNGLMGEPGKRAVEALSNRSYVQARTAEWAEDTRVLHVRGVPTFLSPGRYPLLGEQTAEEISEAFL